MKVLGKTTCPGCNKEHDAEMDLSELDNVEKSNNVSKFEPKQVQNGNTMLFEAPKEIEKIIEVVPDFMPGYRCKDGNCDIGVHKNKNYKKRVKGKCENCGQFSKHPNGDCPWCKKDGKRGEIEPIDDEELDDLGIVAPQIDEHEGHNHE